MHWKEQVREQVPFLVRAYQKLMYYKRFGKRSYPDIFKRIHEKNIWGDKESLSGAGSRLEVTEILRQDLSEWLSQTKIASFVDIPCGDFNWMRKVTFPAGVRYIGIDIVPDIAIANERSFGSRDRRFYSGDILSSYLPPAEAYFCKDLFIHFPNSAIVEALRRVREAGPRYVLVTTFPNTKENVDIKFGEARRVNMALPEFGLGEPVAMLRDFFGDTRDRFIGVWTLTAADERSI